MTDEAAKSTNASTEVAGAAVKRYADATESLRQRADLAAKVLAGAGTTLITAIGIAKFSDLYPIPPDSIDVSWLDNVWLLGDTLGEIQWLTDRTTMSRVELAMVGVIGGFFLMIAAVIAIAYRYWKVTGAVPMRSDLNRMHLKEEELDLVRDTYDEVARLNDVATLNAYEARAHRLERVAKWLPSKDAERARADATLIQTEVLATQTQARLRVLRARVVKAVRGRVSVLLYLLFILGVVQFGLGTDYLASKRTDEITVAKACADARAVELRLSLPPICGTPAEAPSDKALEIPSQVAASKLALTVSLQRCLESADKDDSLDAAACDLIVDAIKSLTPS